MQHELIRIDPALPVCWESQHALRIGFDRAEVRLHDPTPATQRLLLELRNGIAVGRLPSAARKAGASPAERRRLLEQLEPVLVRERPPETESAPPALTVAVLGEGLLAASVRSACSSAGFAVRQKSEAKQSPPDFAIVIERFLEPATRAHPQMLAGAPHLPIRVSDRAVLLGPLIVPGRPPCLGCIELHGLESNPLGPVLASQLLHQLPAAETPACALAMAALAATIVGHWSQGAPLLVGERLRFEVRGGLPELLPTVEGVEAHAQCGCGELRQAPSTSPASAMKREGVRELRPAPAAPEILSSSRARVSAT